MFLGLGMDSNMAILNAFDAILPHRLLFFVHVVFFLVLCVAFSIYACFRL